MKIHSPLERPGVLAVLGVLCIVSNPTTTLADAIRSSRTSGPDVRVALVPVTDVRAADVAVTDVPVVAVQATDAPLTDDPFAPVGDVAVDAVYRPFQAAFATAANTLEERVEALCTAPSPDALKEARDAFADTVSRFSTVELLRTGPLLEDNRLNRLFYWPNTRRAGERQLRALLMAPPDDIDVASMPARSVAVQGMPALERLLHGSAADALAGPRDDAVASDDVSSTDPAPGAATHCAVTAAVAGNVAEIARTLGEAWSSEDGVAREMRSPRAGDPLFRSSAEVVRHLLTQLESGLGVLLERKIDPLLAADPPSLRSAPFTRSGESWTNLAGNVESLRALAIDTGLAEQAGLERELGFEFRIAAGHVARLGDLSADTPPDDYTLGEEASGVIRALASVLTSIRTTVNERLLPTLGTRTGFNAEDGD